ncbi:MAG: hypothetical protein MJ144_04790 [Clostridia bacterium]|nr:hypothetical protein [Clostridia bacterium]
MKLYKSIAALAAVSLVISSAAFPAFAAPEKINNLPSKDETVYVIENSDGSAKKIIVSDIFTNVSAEDAEKNMAGLSDIQNISGDCWQGISDKELPVELTITYSLDGNEISAEELSGKAGHVVIRFDYNNTLLTEADINGETKELHIPFTAITGTVLDNDHFSDIEATNAITFNDGNRTVIAGMTFPGMKEDLSSYIEGSDLDIPDFIEISADTDNFQLTSAVTILSGSISGTDALDDTISQLTSAIGITKGTDGIEKGLASITDKFTELYNGISQLSEGLETLSSNNEALVTGAETVFTTLLATANGKLAESGLDLPELTIENYEEVVGGLVTAVQDPQAYAEASARTQVETAVKENEDQIRIGVTEAVKAQVAPQVEAAVKEKVWEQILTSQGMDAENYDAAVSAGMIDENQQAQLNSALEMQMMSEEVAQAIDSALTEQMESDDIKATIENNVVAQIEALTEENLNSPEVQAQIAAGAEAMAAGAESILTLQAQLSSYNEFYTGLKVYTEGVASASEGAATIAEAIKPIYEKTGTVEEISNIFKAYTDLSQKYTSYTDNTSNLNSNVKFICRTESIE